LRDDVTIARLGDILADDLEKRAAQIREFVADVRGLSNERAMELAHTSRELVDLVRKLAATLQRDGTPELHPFQKWALRDAEEATYSVEAVLKQMAAPAANPEGS
jgi:hypothetical protein